MWQTSVKWIFFFCIISAVSAKPRPSESSEENFFGNNGDAVNHVDGHANDIVKNNIDVCVLPPISHSLYQRRCSGFIPRWYYDNITGVCKKFFWEGCWSTGNLFRNEFACLSRCNRRGLQKLISESDQSAPCLQPKAVGNCLASILSFFFDTQTGKCTSFVYSGCGGNANNFRTYHQCDFKCNRLEQAPLTLPQLANSTIATAPEKAVQLTKREKCNLPPVQPGTASCLAFVPSWTFNSTVGQCQSYVYEGCGRTANLFNSLDECDTACGPEPIVQTSNLPLCLQPKVVGHCRGAFPMFFYDATTEKCTRFIYGGCKGNDNRFVTEHACKLACPGSNDLEVSDQLSAESQETYKSSSSLHIVEWYKVSNPAQRTPEVQLVNLKHSQYSLNTIMLSQTGKLVLLFCVMAVGAMPFDQSTAGETYVHVRQTREDTCSLPPVEPSNKECYKDIPSWTFDSAKGICVRFRYGGCGGTTNLYQSLAECNSICGDNKPVPIVSPSVCLQQMNAGSCFAAIPSFYYDTRRKQCMPFSYGGCGGSENRFESELDCIQLCSSADFGSV
ncbi:papilin-like [Daphnia carinata]|uniref:papilin-like n=1 Tax=Daphnia carinata TaxID=120202 RepID=UPI0028693222|nr:papilin-like [Daphnia carinata]